MQNLTITAPDEIFAQTVNALAYLGGYVDVKEDNDNLKLEFAKEQLITILGDKNRDYAREQIRKAAQANIQKTIEAANTQIAATRPTISVTIKSE